ncbi:hypothetical protein M0F12_13200, partial [Ralstonia solanacearum]|uniref:hypothetical protein n=1 Tax=Ralstonia solanacearum TaxID=305 RepID=UPI002029BD04
LPRSENSGVGWLAIPFTTSLISDSLATQITMGMPVAGCMLGGVIAGAIIDGINAGEKGNLRFYHRQPAPGELKRALMQD